MKKFLAILSLILVAVNLNSQIVTTIPAVITNNYNDTVFVIFDASQGTQGLMNYSGDIYAHTGINTWQHAPAWLTNSDKYKLTPLGNNKHRLDIAPNMATYYGTTAGEVINRLCFVFRNATGSLEGKDVGGADIFVNVIPPSLAVSIANPADNSLIAQNSNVNISVDAILHDSIQLLLNNVRIGGTTAANLSLSHTFTGTGNYWLIAKAFGNGNVVADTAFLCVREPVANAPRPAGLEEGITVYANSDSASFLVYAPYKNFIFLIGDFNDWHADNSYQMKKDDDYFWLTIHNLQQNQEYAFQYFVDGEVHVADAFCKKILDPWNDKWIAEAVYPNLKAYPIGKTDGSASVFNTFPIVNYSWDDASFVLPPKHNLSIYELHLRDFTTQGTFAAAEAKLDYLQNLGINAIELMPIQEFDGNDSWGYNPTFYFAADKAYGTDDDVKHFINACHQRGIAVILDVVFNHAWGECPLIKMWWDAANNRPAANNPYANAIAKHDYNVGNDFNHESIFTRNYFKKVLQYWLEEYHIDGYRFDLSKGFTQNNTLGNTNAWGNYDASRIAILTDYNNTIVATKANAYHILEHFAVNSEEIALANAGMMLWNNINNAACQTTMGFPSNCNMQGLIAAQRAMTVTNLVGYIESHDEERIGYKTITWGNYYMSGNQDMRCVRTAMTAALSLLTPGPHLIWQFGELDYDYSIDYNGRTGRKPVKWEYFDEVPRRYVYNMYSNVLALRNKFPSVFEYQDAPEFTYALSALTSSFRKISYNTNELKLVVLGNYDTIARTQNVALPELPSGKIWYDYLRQQPANISGTNPSITIEDHQMLILMDSLVATPIAWQEINVGTLEEMAKEQTLSIYPNPARDYIVVQCATCNDVKYAEIYDINGKLHCTLHFAHSTNIDISTLKSGMYFLKIGKQVARFVKE